MSSQAFLRSMFASEEESESESLLESESLDELSSFFCFLFFLSRLVNSSIVSSEVLFSF